MKKRLVSVLLVTALVLCGLMGAGGAAWAAEDVAWAHRIWTVSVSNVGAQSEMTIEELAKAYPIDDATKNWILFNGDPTYAVKIFECAAPVKFELVEERETGQLAFYGFRIHGDEQQLSTVEDNYIILYGHEVQVGSYVILHEPGWYVVQMQCEGGYAFSYVIVSDASTPTPPAPPPADTTGIQVTLNGTPISFDQPPIMENGRTLVPLRAIFEALGATVNWDGDTQTVTATRGDTTVSLTIGSDILTKNGQEVVLDVPAKSLSGRTLVPARAVAESFEATVNWDRDTQTVIITN